MKEQKFEKVKEKEFDNNRLTIFLSLGFLAQFIFILVFLNLLIPEWNNTFFPLGYFFIFNILLVILIFYLSFKTNVYWRKIK